MVAAGSDALNSLTPIPLQTCCFCRVLFAGVRADHAGCRSDTFELTRPLNRRDSAVSAVFCLQVCKLIMEAAESVTPDTPKQESAVSATFSLQVCELIMEAAGSDTFE
jgi:hypothetical protein